MKANLNGTAEKLEKALTELAYLGQDESTEAGKGLDKATDLVTEAVVTLREILVSYDDAMAQVVKQANNGSLVLNRKDLLDLRATYVNHEQRGKDLVEKVTKEMREITEKEREDKRIVREMYLYQQGKAAGQKEEIDEMFFKADGVFPRHETEALQEK